MQNLRWLTLLGAAFGVMGSVPGGSDLGAGGEEIARLARRNAEAQSALVAGDIDGFLERVPPAEDFTLMSPFGGTPKHGFDWSREHRDEMARFFQSGTLDQEFVASYASGDLVVLVTIERARAAVGGLPEQNWGLRVTQVFRRDGTEWRLEHRHADPLANGISLQQAAALGRGDSR
jgi:ketosteroid isomerase-like protein